MKRPPPRHGKPERVAIVRFPGDQAQYSGPAVAKVMAEREGWALVAKFRMRRQAHFYWGKPRWVPAGDIARDATTRELYAGHPIDHVPPRLTAALEKGTAE